MRVAVIQQTNTADLQANLEEIKGHEKEARSLLAKAAKKAA